MRTKSRWKINFEFVTNWYDSRLKLRFFYLILLNTLVFFGCDNVSLFWQAPTPSWVEIAPDLKILKTNTFPLSGELIFIKSSLAKYRIRVVRAAELNLVKSDIKTLTESVRGKVGINASFFDEHNKPLGLVISKGKHYQKLISGGNLLTAIFQVNNKGIPEVVSRTQFELKGVLEALQAGPRLILEGQKVGGINDQGISKRSGVCIKKDGDLILYSSAAEFFGIRIQELQDLLLQPEINCHVALNLDGGGSAQVHIADYLSVQGDDEVPIALVLVRKS
jgi:uncharacterized protein YigE (DUF2233 family)